MFKLLLSLLAIVVAYYWLKDYLSIGNDGDTVVRKRRRRGGDIKKDSMDIKDAEFEDVE